MTTFNNYDASSTGTNIEFKVFYDTDLSRLDFYMFFEDMGFVKFFHDGGIVDKMERIEVPFDALLDMLTNKLDNNEADVLEALIYLGCDGDTIKDCEENYNGDVTLHAVNELYYLSTKDIESLLPEGLALHVSRGYSQGDSVLVIRHAQEYPSNSMIDRYLWDTPVYGHVKIDDEDFYIDEFLDDSYMWDKDSFIENLTETIQHPKKEYIIGWLNDNLPNELEYI